MFARRHRKQQFRVEVAQPPQRRPPRLQVGVERQHAKHRFHVEPPERSQPGFLPISVLIERWRGRKRSSATATVLSQRRRVHRRALLLALGCLLLIAIVGSLSFTSLMRTRSQAKALSPALSSAVGGPHVGLQQGQHTLATRPFTSLAPSTSDGDLSTPIVQAAAAFLFDPGQFRVYFEKDADEVRPIASLTKVMTLLVASDTGNLDQPVTVGPDAAALVNGANSHIGVSAGEQLSLRDLLYGFTVGPGNDAAVAVADAVSGTRASFVATMNRRAAQLGLTQTVFVSPDGLDDGNRSTARELAVLAAVALGQAGVEQITSTRHYIIPQTTTHKAYDLLSGNDLLSGGSSPYPGANGIKTGYTVGALYCMAFSARRNGHLLVGVVLGDPSAKARASDAHALLDWGFAHEQSICYRMYPRCPSMQ